jgi:hypothetical protein
MSPNVLCWHLAKIMRQIERNARSRASGSSAGWGAWGHEVPLI